MEPHRTRVHRVSNEPNSHCLQMQQDICYQGRYTIKGYVEYARSVGQPGRVRPGELRGIYFHPGKPADTAVGDRNIVLRGGHGYEVEISWQARDQPRVAPVVR